MYLLAGPVLFATTCSCWSGISGLPNFFLRNLLYSCFLFLLRVLCLLAPPSRYALPSCPCFCPCFVLPTLGHELTERGKTEYQLGKKGAELESIMPPLPPRPMRGMSLQRSVSSRLMQADQMPQGEELWVEDDRDVWVLASLVKQQNTILTVRRKDTGETIEIDLVSENGTCTWFMPSKRRSFLSSSYVFIGCLIVWWFPQKKREGIILLYE